MDFLNTDSTSVVNKASKNETFILVYPPQNFIQNEIAESKEKNLLLNSQTGLKMENFQQIRQYSMSIEEKLDLEPKLESDSQFYHYDVSQKKRKNKTQKLKEIEENKADDGRGGNCVASNICKTLLRIVLFSLHQNLMQKFHAEMRKYNIRSQKENSTIIILLLHVWVKKEKINFQTYEKIFNQFMKTLKESEANCEKKGKDQESRRGFHTKNKRMYRLFSEISQQLYNRSVNYLSNGEVWNIKSLEEIVSETYDRKQRQVEKAMNKIRSIILNQEELREFFDYHEVDVEMAFYQSIDYAYRRNLPKRCRQIKERTRIILQRFKSRSTLFFSIQSSMYMTCYMTLKLLKEKEKQIWQEFICNLFMKQEFNKSVEEKRKFRVELSEDIPKKFNMLLSIKQSQEKPFHMLNQQQEMSSNNCCKVEEETSDYEDFQNKIVVDPIHHGAELQLLAIYKELQQTLEF